MLMILLVFNFNNTSISDIDYEDIYVINDYEYPYNHINNLINRIIDIDVILHKAGDNYVNMHGDANKFTHDCIEVRINKVI